LGDAGVFFPKFERVRHDDLVLKDEDGALEPGLEPLQRLAARGQIFKTLRAISVVVLVGAQRSERVHRFAANKDGGSSRGGSNEDQVRAGEQKGPANGTASGTASCPAAVEVSVDFSARSPQNLRLANSGAAVGDNYDRRWKRALALVKLFSSPRAVPVQEQKNGELMLGVGLLERHRPVVPCLERNVRARLLLKDPVHGEILFGHAVKFQRHPNPIPIPDVNVNA
jgi:hypothetical protein